MGVGCKSIFCGGCKSWVHKKCFGISGSLKRDPSFRCARCLVTARPVDGRIITEVQMGNDKLEVVTDFCYLGDMISAGKGCKLSSITRCKSAWSKFHQLLPLLTNPHLLFKTRGQIYNTYIRAVMLFSSETWSLTTPFLNRLKCNVLAMIQRVEDRKNAKKLYAKLGIQKIEPALRCHRLKWFGHVMRSSGWLSKVRDFKVIGVKRLGKPKKTWEKLLKKDRAKLSLMEFDQHDNLTWKKTVFKKALPSADENGL